jgi:hypothetical protein
MTFNLEGDEALSAAIAGLPKIAELIAAVPTEDRARALEAAEKSYMQTALNLGYDDAGAQQWASTVMLRLRLGESVEGTSSSASGGAASLVKSPINPPDPKG